MFAVFDMTERSVPRYLTARFLNHDGSRPGMACLVLLRLTLTAITILMAILVPHFTLFAAFIGSGTGTAIAVIFPCIFYLKIFYWQLKWYQVIPNVFIVCFGVLMSACGMISTGRELFITLKQDSDYWNAVLLVQTSKRPKRTFTKQSKHKIKDLMCFSSSDDDARLYDPLIV